MVFSFEQYDRLVIPVTFPLSPWSFKSQNVSAEVLWYAHKTSGIERLQLVNSECNIWAHHLWQTAGTLLDLQIVHIRTFTNERRTFNMTR